jgi:hypothetical protein
MDIFNIPLYYISFHKNQDLEDNYKKHGFTNIHHFKAVDGKKFKPLDLLQDKLITTRCYEDLIKGRSSFKGMPSVGAIGCTMSHNELWKLCINNNLPYIIIVEDDSRIRKNLTVKNIQDIRDAITEPNGIFVSAHITQGKYNVTKDIFGTKFFGTQLYFASNSACHVMSKNCFPIDIQTDCYISHLSDIGSLKITGYKLDYVAHHMSSIQDSNYLLYILPKNPLYYIIVACIVILILSYFLFRCKRSLKK